MHIKTHENVTPAHNETHNAYTLPQSQHTWALWRLTTNKTSTSEASPEHSVALQLNSEQIYSYTVDVLHTPSSF